MVSEPESSVSRSQTGHSGNCSAIPEQPVPCPEDYWSTCSFQNSHQPLVSYNSSFSTPHTIWSFESLQGPSEAVVKDHRITALPGGTGKGWWSKFLSMYWPLITGSNSRRGGLPHSGSFMSSNPRKTARSWWEQWFGCTILRQFYSGSSRQSTLSGTGPDRLCLSATLGWMVPVDAGWMDTRRRILDSWWLCAPSTAGAASAACQCISSSGHNPTAIGLPQAFSVNPHCTPVFRKRPHLSTSRPHVDDRALLGELLRYFQILLHSVKFISDSDWGNCQDPNPGPLSLGLKSVDIVKNKKTELWNSFKSVNSINHFYTQRKQLLLFLIYSWNWVSLFLFWLL